MTIVGRDAIAFGTLVLALVFASACEDDEKERDRFERNRALWANNGFSDYDVRIDESCIVCGGPNVLVQVRGGAKVAIVDSETREILSQALGPDVEELFDWARRAIEDADRFEIDYDDELGYPSRIEIDFDVGPIDDEMRFEVLSLIPTSEPVSTLAERVVMRRAQ